MSKTAYLFETSQIQRFIFEGGKLRDMVAASDQLDSLCGDPLSQVLETCGLVEDENIWFSRKSGGAIYAILNNEEKARELQSLWSFYVRKHFPGIRIVQVIKTAESIEKAMKLALESMLQSRNLIQAQYPVPGPLMRRSPRTGEAVVKWDSSRKEWIDESIRLKRFGVKPHSSLVKKFTPDNQPYREHAWPVNFEPSEGAFPFLNEDRTIALIHADGNGLGELLIVLGKVAAAASKSADDEFLYINLFRKFSNAIEASTQAAAKDAMQTLFDMLPENTAEHSVIPARPLVLGGDDLTILIRADLALPFTVKFCEAFSEHTEKELAGLYADAQKYLNDAQASGEKQAYNLNRLKKLTACAGVAFIKANQPFMQAYYLAESLCEEAKNQSRSVLSAENTHDLIPASLAFHKVSAALIEPVSAVRRHEWQVEVNRQPCELAMGVYGLHCDLPDFYTLQNLANLFGDSKLNRAGLRQVATLLKEDPDKAQMRYARWRDIEAAKKDDSGKSYLDQYDTMLATLCDIEQNDKIPFDKSSGKSPLIDLLLLINLAIDPRNQEAAS
ncbi:MAG: hypothetical protein CSA51_01575 [Gammaproteobacteria bacterium]|nr:MAG: hypothetical protein CSA51_01575 [Gammaproteobacteria bacterium]